MVKESTQTFREICLPVQCGDDGASLERMLTESIPDTLKMEGKAVCYNNVYVIACGIGYVMFQKA